MDYGAILDTKDNKDIILGMTTEQIRGLIHYFLFNRLGFKDDKDVMDNICYKDFVDNNLVCLLNLYNKSPYIVLNIYYKEFRKSDCRLYTKLKWIDDNIQDTILRILDNNKLYSDKDILDNFTVKFLESNGLPRSFYKRNRTLFDLLNITFPGRFKSFQLKGHPRYFWDNPNNVKEALDYILDKYNISYRDASNKLRSKMFNESGLKGLLSHFGYSYNSILSYIGIHYSSMLYGVSS